MVAVPKPAEGSPQDTQPRARAVDRESRGDAIRGHLQQLRDQLGRMARDVFTLEINTVVRPWITGCKMEHADHALLDVAEWFDARLGKLGVPRTSSSAWSPRLPALLPEPREEWAQRLAGVLVQEHNDFGGPFAFEQLRARAKAGLLMLENAGEGGDGREAKALMLLRICDSSEQILGIHESHRRRMKEDYQYPMELSHREIAAGTIPETEFSASELLILRKVWELGVEEIVAQTVIQIDGDVVTRITPRISADRALLDAHQVGVGTSMRFWEQLVGLILDTMERVRKLVLP